MADSTSEREMVRPGPLDGLSRVLAELLRTPRFKQTIRILLRDLDPEGAAAVVRVLVWEDPEFFLGLLSATPDILNAMACGFAELVRQIAGFPPELLSRFAAETVAGLDAATMGEVAGGVLVVADRLAATDTSSLEDAGAGLAETFAEGYARSGAPAGPELAARLAGAIRDFAAANPKVMKEIVAPVVAAGREALAAAEDTASDGEAS